MYSSNPITLCVSPFRPYPSLAQTVAISTNKNNMSINCIQVPNQLDFSIETDFTLSVQKLSPVIFSPYGQ